MMAHKMEVATMIQMLGLMPAGLDPKVADDFIQAQINALRGAQGLIDMVVSKGAVMSPGGPPPFTQAFQARWHSLEDMMAWTQAQGATEEADVGFMLQNGAVLIFYELQDV
jgi:hypothetical protein